MMSMTFAADARSAAMPVRRMPFCRTRQWCVVRQNGTSTSISAYRFLTKTSAARFASQYVPGAYPVAGRELWSSCCAGLPANRIHHDPSLSAKLAAMPAKGWGVRWDLCSVLPDHSRTPAGRCACKALRARGWFRTLNLGCKVPSSVGYLRDRTLDTHLRDSVSELTRRLLKDRVICSKPRFQRLDSIDD